MIELQLPAGARDLPLGAVRRAIRAHRKPDGEPIAILVGKRRVELGDGYRVDGSTACLAKLMTALDAFQ